MIDQHASLSEKFLKKGFWLYLFSFIIAPIGYIIKIIISGELEVEEVGILYGIISLITMISAYNDLGMSESIHHFVPQFVTEKRYDKVKTILVYAFIAQMLTGISIALFFFFGADIIALNYFKSQDAIGTLKVFAFYFLGINIIQIISIFFLSVQNTFAQKLVDFMRISTVLLMVIFIFTTDHSSLMSYSYAWIGGVYIGVITAISVFYIRYIIPYLQGEKILWDKSLFTMIFKYGGLVFLGAQAGTILSQIDMQLIIYLLGTKDAGYYTNYLSIISIPFVFIGPIFALLFPIFSELYAKKEFSKILSIKNMFQSNFLIIGIMFNIFMFVFAETISYILFGEKFTTSGEILKYSILLLSFNFLFQLNFNIMAGIGRVKERVKIMFIAIVFNIVLDVILIRSIGVYGAALATGIGWILIFFLSEFFIGKKYRSPVKKTLIGKNIFILGTIALAFTQLDLNLFENLSRVSSFMLLCAFFIIWTTIFGMINYSRGIIFLQEIKKLRAQKG